MAYSRGNSKQVIVGAAALFVSSTGDFDPTNTSPVLPDFVNNESYRTTLTDQTTPTVATRNVGYTSNGLEIQFQPDFGEVQVDQLLDVAKMYKQGMKVNLNTAFAEATLENLMVAIAANSSEYDQHVKMKNPIMTGTTGSFSDALEILSGNIGECPVERGIVAVGPGTGDCEVGTSIERIYLAYRALSIDNVTVSAKRDAPSVFEVSFRLLPADNGSYGKIVDRTLVVS
jgi:hypothetical protein